MPKPFDRPRQAAALAVGCALTLLGGCPPLEPPPVERFVNTTDKTNNQAAFAGAAACRACHAGIAVDHAAHGHAFMLNAVSGGAPTFPASAAQAPLPPAGLNWPDISYVIGGFARRAVFLGDDGYLLTTGAIGVPTQWTPAFAANGNASSHTPFDPQASSPRAYDENCYGCHTTGPLIFDPAAPRFQENRPGIPGGWHEAGVQCEACHGPGSGHFGAAQGAPLIDRARIYVDPSGAQTCATCHNGPWNDRSDTINARDGYIEEYEQWAELRASGGHADFACTFCHNPHVSLNADRGRAIRNECRACHPASEISMAGHGGKTFRRGDYVEPLTCESCHMPFAGRSGGSAGPDVVGPQGRSGDVRTHIFRIDTAARGFEAMFSGDGTTVQRDAQGRAAVTVDFVCLRCHNGLGNVFNLSITRAAEIAGQIHRLP